MASEKGKKVQVMHDQQEIAQVILRGVEVGVDAGAMPAPPRRGWPRCLTWSDEQVSEVERWLAEGGAPPEVLR